MSSEFARYCQMARELGGAPVLELIAAVERLFEKLSDDYEAEKKLAIKRSGEITHLKAQVRSLKQESSKNEQRYQQLRQKPDANDTRNRHPRQNYEKIQDVSEHLVALGIPEFLPMAEFLTAKESEYLAKIEALIEKLKIASLKKYAGSSDRSDKSNRDEGDTGDSEDEEDQPQPTDTEPEESAENDPRTSNGRAPTRFPDNIEEEHRIIKPDSTQCGHCDAQMRDIGEEVTTFLDVKIVFKKIVEHRIKCVCPICNTFKQAPATLKLLENSSCLNSTLTYLITERFADHKALNRIQESFARHGISYHRGTMSRQLQRAGDFFFPIFNRMEELLLSGPVVHLDETRVPKVGEEPGKAKICWDWAIGRDYRTWASDLPPIIIHKFKDSRRQVHPEDIFKGYNPKVIRDRCPSHNILAKKDREGGSIELVNCHAHWRRKFSEVHRTSKSPLALRVIRDYKKLYDIERDVRGQDHRLRRAERQRYAKPILEGMIGYLRAELPARPQKLALAGSILYGLADIEGFTRYLDDGRLEIDNNMIEREMRSIAMSRKNVYFAGSDEGAHTWMIFASLVGTCKLNGVNFSAYIKWAADKLAGNHPASKIDELLPWNFPE